MISRRELLAGFGALAIRLPVGPIEPKPARLAVITDLHHGLAPDALSRLKSFADAVKQRNNLDAVLQMGDFCYSDAGSKECLDLWNSIPGSKMHVLGNHDMDKVDKDTAVRAWRMRRRFGSRMIGGYRFIHLDLNHFKKEGKLYSYANGNYFTEGASHNWADPPQLSWLREELKNSRDPVIILSHQPLGFLDGGKLPTEQKEVMDILATGPVAACLFGHLHVDRLETYAGIPCLCVNSASYFWSAGMHPYSKPLFAFMEFGADGILRIEGRGGSFLKPPPKESDSVIGRSASLSDRQIRLERGSRR